MLMRRFINAQSAKLPRVINHFQVIIIYLIEYN